MNIITDDDLKVLLEPLAMQPGVKFSMVAGKPDTLAAAAVLVHLLTSHNTLCPALPLGLQTAVTQEACWMAPLWSSKAAKTCLAREGQLPSR